MKPEREAWLLQQQAQIRLLDPADLAAELAAAAGRVPAGAKIAIALPLDASAPALVPAGTRVALALPFVAGVPDLRPLWDVQQVIERPATQDLLIRATRTIAPAGPALDARPVPTTNEPAPAPRAKKLQG